jgi:hypothetical protein
MNCSSTQRPFFCAPKKRAPKKRALPTVDEQQQNDTSAAQQQKRAATTESCAPSAYCAEFDYLKKIVFEQPTIMTVVASHLRIADVLRAAQTSCAMYQMFTDPAILRAAFAREDYDTLWPTAKAVIVRCKTEDYIVAILRAILPLVERHCVDWKKTSRWLFKHAFRRLMPKCVALVLEYVDLRTIKLYKCVKPLIRFSPFTATQYHRDAELCFDVLLRCRTSLGVGPHVLRIGTKWRSPPPPETYLHQFFWNMSTSMVARLIMNNLLPGRVVRWLFTQPGLGTHITERIPDILRELDTFVDTKGAPLLHVDCVLHSLAAAKRIVLTPDNVRKLSARVDIVRLYKMHQKLRFHKKFKEWPDDAVRAVNSITQTEWTAVHDGIDYSRACKLIQHRCPRLLQRFLRKHPALRLDWLLDALAAVITSKEIRSSQCVIDCWWKPSTITRYVETALLTNMGFFSSDSFDRLDIVSYVRNTHVLNSALAYPCREHNTLWKSTSANRRICNDNRRLSALLDAYTTISYISQYDMLMDPESGEYSLAPDAILDEYHAYKLLKHKIQKSGDKTTNIVDWIQSNKISVQLRSASEPAVGFVQWLNMDYASALYRAMLAEGKDLSSNSGHVSITLELLIEFLSVIKDPSTRCLRAGMMLQFSYYWSEDITPLLKFLHADELITDAENCVVRKVARRLIDKANVMFAAATNTLTGNTDSGVHFPRKRKDFFLPPKVYNNTRYDAIDINDSDHDSDNDTDSDNYHENYSDSVGNDESDNDGNDDYP